MKSGKCTAERQSRVRSIGRGELLHLFLLLLFSSWAVYPIQSVSSQETNRSIENDLFAPPPGVLTRPLQQAKTALAKEDYQTAIESLAKIIGPESQAEAFQEDFLLPTREVNANQSIRREAWDLIANMPARGRSLFELKYGVAAGKQLEQAIEVDDLEQLKRVSQDYLHTKAGYAATLLLGKSRMFEGDMPLAIRYFRKLHTNEVARQALDPDLSIHFALSLTRNGQLDEGVRVLSLMKETHPNLRFLYGDRLVEHTLDDEPTTRDFIADLVMPNGMKSREKVKNPALEWLSLRSAENLSEGPEDIPLPIPSWSVRTANSSQYNLYQRLDKQRFVGGTPAMPVFQPVALKDSVVFRTTEKTYAVDSSTGKRIWQYPWSHQEKAKVETEAIDAKQEKLKLWTRSIDARVTSDGKRVFFVQRSKEVPLASSPAMIRRTELVPSNTLVALQIVNSRGVTVQGQLAWKIDTSGDDPEFSGSVFLGPPLIHMQKAYVLYERSGQIRVAAFRSTDGKLIWSQQIASTQSKGGFDQKLFRYRTSSTPFLARGLLICPTMVGGLVAIDLSDLTLKWGFKYESLGEANYLQLLEDSANFSPWLDNSLFLVGDQLCFSPVDGRNFYVLELESGKIQLTDAKDNRQFLAGRFRDMLVSVEQDAVILEQVKGQSSFKVEFGAHGQAAGRGLFAGSFYYLPVSDRKLLKIDLEQRKIAQVVPMARQLGNLSYYQGQLISQSIYGLDAYWMKKSATQIVGESPTNTDAPTSHLIRAQLAYLENRMDEAVSEMILSASEVPAELSLEFLAQLLTARIGEGGDLPWELLEKGYSLLSEPSHRRSYLLAKMEHEFAAGRGGKVLDDLIQLVDLYVPDGDSGDNLIPVSKNRSVSGLRLIRSRLQQALGDLGIDQQLELQKKIRRRFEDEIASQDSHRIRLFAEMFGQFDLVKESIPILVSIPADQNSQYSLWLGSLITEMLERETDLTNRTNLLAALARLIHNDQAKSISAVEQTKPGEPTNRPTASNAADQLAAIVTLLNKIPVDARTGDWKQIHTRVENWTRAAGKPLPDLPPDGMTKIEICNEDEIEHLLLDSQDIRYRSTIKQMSRISPSPYQVEFNNLGYFMLRDPYGQLVYQDNSRVRGSRLSNHRYDLSDVQVLGDLMILSCGYDHVALDLRKIEGRQGNPGGLFDGGTLVGDALTESESTVLWRHSSIRSSRQPGSTRSNRESNSLSLVAQELFDQEGSRVGKTTKLSSKGFCILSGDSLHCLDPWTGEVNWIRTGLPKGADLTGDDQCLYVIAPDDKTVLVFDTLAGQPLETCSVPPEMINRIGQHGSHVVSISQNRGSTSIHGFQLAPGSIRKIWSRDFEEGTRAAWFDSFSLATLDPGGQFSKIDVRTGKVIQNFQVQANIKCATLRIEPLGNQYLVIANARNHAEIESSRNEFGSGTRPIINVDGALFLCDESGPVWSTPALVDGYDWVLNQPAKSPVFMLKKRSEDRKATELIFLRRSDGSLIRFANKLDYVGQTTNTHYSLERTSFLFTMGYQWLELRLTDFPRPPEPPARAGKYSDAIDQNVALKVQRKLTGDPFLDQNDDPFRSSLPTIKKWIEKEWRLNPMNPDFKPQRPN